MGMDAAQQTELRAIIDAALRGGVSEAQADRVYEIGPDAVSAFVLATTRRFAELDALDEFDSKNTLGPHTPFRLYPAVRQAELVEVAELKTCPDCDAEVMPADARASPSVCCATRTSCSRSWTGPRPTGTTIWASGWSARR